VDRRLDRPDTRIGDSLLRELRVADAHLISSLVVAGGIYGYY